jgi:hypothetical protein
MKRSLGTAELPVLRPLVPDTADDSTPPVEPAAEEPAPVPSAEPNAAGQAPMAFPGPFAYVPKPAAMEDGDTKPGSASSASSGREGSGEAVVRSGSLAAAHSLPHSGPAPAAGGSTTVGAGAAITHATAGDDNPHGYPPLILAAYKGRLAEVKLLLEDPDVDIDQVDQKLGATALIAASCTNKPEVVALLLARGAKVNLVSGRHRRTVLIDAAFRGQVAVVKALLTRRDIAVDATDAFGYSALAFAASKNHPDVVACLLEAGASMTIRTRDGDTPLDLAIKEKHAAVVEVLLQHGAVLPKFDYIDTNAEPSAVAFAVTLADLVADLKSPADLEGNPLGLIAPDSLDDPVAVINRVFKLFPEWEYEPDLCDAQLLLDRDQVKRELQGPLYEDGIRAACLVPIGECLASFPEVSPLFMDIEEKTNEKQMQLALAAALGGLSAMTANGAALRHYKAAGISAEGIARLSAVATRQIDKLIALSEALLTTAGSDMLEELMPACLFRTGLENAVDTETLITELCKARWLKPVAQAIVTSWEAALAALGAEPVSLPAGLTLKQITQLLSEHVKREAPLRFVQMLQKELAAPTLLAAKRTWQERTWMERRGFGRGDEPVFKMLTHEGIELLFQIQCDQLRQYCEQTGRAD